MKLQVSKIVRLNSNLIGSDGADNGTDFARVFGIDVNVLPPVEPPLLIEELAVCDAHDILGL